MNLKRHLWAVIHVLLSTASFGGQVEDESIGTFELYCVENINQQAAIPGLLSSIGIQPLESGVANMLLNGQTGKAWLLNQSSTKMFLALTDKGVCTVFARDANPEVARTLFASTFRNKRMQSENIGSQTEEMFLVTQASRSGEGDIHLVVVTNASNLASVPGMILNAIPEAVAKEMGLTFSDWP